MTRIVNLRTRRKQAARDAARKAGDANAARHGIARPLRELAARRVDKDNRALDGHRRDFEPEGD